MARKMDALLERTFDLSLSGLIEGFYLHVSDHHAGRCKCDQLLDETETLAFRLDQARSNVKETHTTLRGETPTQ